MKLFLNLKNSFLLLVAPPGWGKTSIILKILKQSSHKKFIFISPLKALVNEQREVLSKFVYDGPLLKFSKAKEKIFLCTPESFLKGKGSNLNAKDIIIIWDEFHLLDSWGSTFRPTLWEVFYLLASKNYSFLALTATLENSFTQFLNSVIPLNFSDSAILDYGNYTFKNRPQKIIKVLHKNILYDNLKGLKKSSSEGKTIIFCAYRNEVEYVSRFLEQENIKSLSCVGGETDKFAQELKKDPNYDVIVSTSCLSHGVNLPKISKVFITYNVERRADWFQMVGRGGRRGECFSVYSLNSYEASKSDYFYSFAFYLFANLKKLIKVFF